MGAVEVLHGASLDVAPSRFVGFLYVLAFAALIPQVDITLGSRGLLPIAQRLDRIRRDFPGWRRLLDYPSVMWLSASDRTSGLARKP